MALWSWLRTPAGNATADTTINWAEGQAPSSINDSARAMMARIAEYRDDIAGAIVTGGTSTAYTISTYEVFDTLAHMANQMVAFTPHVTNGAGPVTLAADAVGAKPLRTSPNTELQAGMLIQGTPYTATYNNTDGAFYLQNFYGNPYNIPLGGFLAYAGGAAPNSSFVLPFGQAISRTTYATLFSLVGTTYGAGDGSTTFNIPDLRGRGIFFKDTMGGVAAGRITAAGSGIDAVNLSATGGAEAVTLTTSQIPSHTHSGNTGAMSANASHSHGVSNAAGNPTVLLASTGGGAAFTGGGQATATAAAAITINAANTDHTHAFTTDGGTGGGGAHNNMPPAYILNCIMRVI